jgi:glycerol-3-phosphate dehydrogenase (NAD(P)+)
MNQKMLILWLGAFGFAIAKHLWENNPGLTIYASEINQEIYNSICDTRTHPFFFEWVKLPKNIELIANTQDFLPEVDIIISIIPCQFVAGAFSGMKEYLKDWVTILNLSKWIDNQSMQTVSEKLSEVLTGINYTYAYLAGGMIAQELVNGTILGADIITQNEQAWETLKHLFSSDFLDINLKNSEAKNTELYAALKNIIALVLGYYEGQWIWASSRWYYLSKLLEEMKSLIILLDWSPEIDFTDYALCWDLIATCFGWSRNRFLGNMLGEWTDIQTALSKLKAQNKIAEWYETLKWVYKLTQWKAGFEEINKFGKKYL